MDNIKRVFVWCVVNGMTTGEAVEFIRLHVSSSILITTTKEDILTV